MSSPITPQKIYEMLKSLPEESLQKVWEYIEFMKDKKNNGNHTKVIKLGGLLADHKIDVSEDEIAKARKEMWHNLGKIN